MLLSIAALNAPAARDDAIGLDPGISTFLLRAVSAVRHSFASRLDSQAAALIAAEGGSLSDDLERRIATGFMTGRF